MVPIEMVRSKSRRFLDANVKLSRSTADMLGLPTDKTLWNAFEREVDRRIRELPDGAEVLDIGGGRRFVYHHALRPGIRLVSVDVSYQELQLNEHADEIIVADVSKNIPLPDGCANLVISRAVLEHVSDVRAAAHEIARVLSPDGYTHHLLAGRDSLTAIAARILPFRPLLWLLHRVLPETADEVEFEVHYDRGTPAELDRVFREAGFTDVDASDMGAAGIFRAILSSVLAVLTLRDGGEAHEGAQAGLLHFRASNASKWQPSRRGNDTGSRTHQRLRR